MTSNRNIKLKVWMAKWLLTTTLVISLFVPFGSAARFALQQQKAQTELFYFNNAKPAYRAVAYQIRATHVPIQLIQDTSLLHTCHLLVYGRLSKVKFDQLVQQAGCLKIYKSFHHCLKTTPPNKGEDPGDCSIA